MIVARRALLVFPLAALLNSFSMTLLMLVFGVGGHSEVAADIGLVQGATLALFYAFSANARNLILADKEPGNAIRLMQARLALIGPLAIASYLLAVGIGGAASMLAIVLIFRKVAEWMGEIGLARHELANQTNSAFRVVVVESASLLLAVVLTIGFGVDLAFSSILWAFAPLLAVRGAKLSLKGGAYLSLGALLPHFGSTAVIGMSTYVFRISIVLLTGKLVAGDLFVAFAIGGLVPTLLGQALAPSLAYRYGSAAWSKWLLLIPLAMLVVAVVLTLIVVTDPAWLAGLNRSPIFWLASALSIAGGSIMLVAASLRTRLIHSDGGGDVFGPDLLANILIATCVPFVYYVLGPQALSGLYLLSACLSLVFLIGAGPSKWRESHLRLVLLAIATLLVIPVFVQIGGGLFQDPAFVYDPQRSILLLPLPVSVLALFLGIAILGNYAAARRSLTTVFFTAVLFIITSLALSHSHSGEEGAKLILLAQVLLPMFGLVLGEMYGSASREPFFEYAAASVLLVLMPAQLLYTWLQGHNLLVPKVFFFSVYQHLQYVPMVVLSIVIMASVSLWSRGNWWRNTILWLMPITALYLTTSMSIVAIGGFVLLAASLPFFYSYSRWLIAVFVLSLAFAGTNIFLTVHGVLVQVNTNMTWSEKMERSIENEIADGSIDKVGSGSPPGVANISESTSPSGLNQRIEYWRFYANGILSSPQAFFLGHLKVPDRGQYPSAHNYWLDVLYNFGAISALPLIALLIMTVLRIWQCRTRIARDPLLLGTVAAIGYLILVENMIKVGMRQPYPGIITFFIWGLLLARLGAIRPGMRVAAGVH